MEDLLAHLKELHPAVQGGVIPFVIALVVAGLLRRPRLSGLAVIAGFAATMYVTGSLSFESLTAARKIILLGFAAAVLALPLMYFRAGWLRPLLAVAGGASVIWVAQRILQQQPVETMLLWGAGCALYVGWLVFWMDGLNEDTVRGGSAGLGLGMGTGLVALFGSSALLALYGMPLGAAAGAVLLLQMIINKPLPCGRLFTLPLAVIAGATGCLVVLTAQAPWYALIPLALIPLAAKIPMPTRPTIWLHTILLSIITLACAACAVYLVWRVAGSPLD